MSNRPGKHSAPELVEADAPLRQAPPTGGVNGYPPRNRRTKLSANQPSARSERPLREQPELGHISGSIFILFYTRTKKNGHLTVLCIVYRRNGELQQWCRKKKTSKRFIANPTSTGGRKREPPGWDRNRSESSLVVTVYLFLSGFTS